MSIIGDAITATTTAAATDGEPELLGQTVVAIGGSSGIGLATATRARGEGADVILTAVGTTGKIEALSLWAGQSVSLARQPQPAAEIVAELVLRA